jgi:hypothetical protein
LVASVGVEGELSQKHSVGGDDADLGASDEEYDLAVAVGGADRDVAELAEVAQGDLASGVDAVVANPVVAIAPTLFRFEGWFVQGDKSTVRQLDHRPIRRNGADKVPRPMNSGDSGEVGVLIS